MARMVSGGRGGGAGISPGAVTVPVGTTGEVAQLRSTLRGTATWSKLSGASTLAIAAGGAISLSAALGSGGLVKAVVRVANSLGDAIEREVSVAAAAGPVTPSPISSIVIEGDSITSGTPGVPNGSYGWQYVAALPPGISGTNRAQGSRSIGTPSNLNDGGNTLFGHAQEDVQTFDGQLITAKIGANDFALGTVSAYRTNLPLYNSELKAAGNARFAWSPPLPYNPTGTPHANKANFDAQRAALLATCRDPAVWGQWCDYYLPLGEMPDFGDPELAAPLFGDTVHPNDTGQNLLFTGYKPAVDTLLNPSRANSTAPFASVWPSSEGSLAPASSVIRRLIVSGIAHKGLALGASITGADAQIRLNGGAWAAAVGNGPANGHRIYNGDVVEVRVTTSADNATAVTYDFTIGSETRTITLTTAADVPATNLVAGGLVDMKDQNSATHSASGVAFPALGLGVIAIAAYDEPTTVTYKGAAATRRVGVVRGEGAIGTFIYTVPVTSLSAGDLVITYARALPLTTAYTLTIENADPTPFGIYDPSQDANTIPTWTISGVTVPSKGIAIVALRESGGAGSASGSVTTGVQVFEGYGSLTNGERYGLIVGQRSTDGPFVINYNAYSNQPIVAAVFKALGS